MKLFSNAKEEPKIYYAKHIAPGVCAYEDETILIGEETLKQMDKTFAGKPVYVNHQRVDLENLQQQADGYVSESFYLPEDGCHWLKMIIVSDRGHEVVKKGWKVSNAYIPESRGVGGEWHNVPYQWEVTSGKYTHLALVDNPRYEEAQIMTPEEFKKYKETKREQLKQLQNSKKQGETKMSFKLWKKKEVENSEDFSEAMVELADGSSVSIKEMVNAVEKDLVNKKNCDELKDKVVKVNGEDMKISDLVAAFEKLSKKNADEDEDKKDKSEDKGNKKNADDEDKKDKSSDEKKDKKNEDDEDKKEEKGNSKNRQDLEEAEEKANAKEFGTVIADTMSRKLARGQERYGSAK